MSVLILGGAGYIGSHAVKYFVNQEVDTVVFDNLETGHEESLPKEARFYQGDIRNLDDLRNVFRSERITAVLHFAAYSLVGESMASPLNYYENNVYGTNQILKAMKEAGVQHIVFSSTAAVYGTPEQTPITEEMPVKPESTYGETKRAMEAMIHYAAEAHGFSYVALRYFNVAGAAADGTIGEDHRPETHLVPIILETALHKRESISVFGSDYPTRDGTCIRDYVHVEDLAEAHYLAWKHLENGGDSDVFNLGTNHGFTVQEIIETARSITGQEIPASNAARRTGDPSTLIASPHKAKTILGWVPSRTNVTTIIEDAWRWHKNRPNGYRKENSHEHTID